MKNVIFILFFSIFYKPLLASELVLNCNISAMEVIDPEGTNSEQMFCDDKKVLEGGVAYNQCKDKQNLFVKIIDTNNFEELIFSDLLDSSDNNSFSLKSINDENIFYESLHLKGFEGLTNNNTDYLIKLNRYTLDINLTVAVKDTEKNVPPFNFVFNCEKSSLERQL